ncbi:MAG: hypothetical protein AMXMBFR37_21930 [Steroidobacteraceae bacterium]
MPAALLTLAFVAGFGITLQVGFNDALRGALGTAGLATFVNFSVGIVALLAFVLAVRTPLPSREAIAGAPWWAWFGGMLGAFYVAAVTIAGPRLGATLLIAVTVLGQLVAALLVDHYGWLGFPQQPVSLTRLAGCVLLLGGVLLVSRS